LSGNALALAAIRATLSKVLTAESYERTIPLAVRFTQGVQDVIDKYKLPWSITRLGNRAEYWFRAHRPRNGTEAVTSADGDLDRYMHIYTINRGILLTYVTSLPVIFETLSVY
jgi:glutamate-1-semialdehyde 2,1-aminomutase